MPELQQNFGTMRRYMPAVLRQNSMGWYIEYYAYNQISQNLERKRVRVNRERKRARTFAEFRSITSRIPIAEGVRGKLKNSTFEVVGRWWVVGR